MVKLEEIAEVKEKLEACRKTISKAENETGKLAELLVEHSQSSGLAQYVQAVRSLHREGISRGYGDLCQLGTLRELVMAQALDHKFDSKKRGPDANCNGQKFEYLTSKIKRGMPYKKKDGRGPDTASFQFDRIYGVNHTQKQITNSLSRIGRNDFVYFGLFDDNYTLDLLAVWEISAENVFEFARSKRETNKSNHINMPLKWVKENGRLVFTNE